MKGLAQRFFSRPDETLMVFAVIGFACFIGLAVNADGSNEPEYVEVIEGVHIEERSIEECRAEDGTYLLNGEKVHQPICVWDASRLGNKRGSSYLVLQDDLGEDPSYYRLTHEEADRITD